MEEEFYYYEKEHRFASRHHVINHIDMILGLSENEKKMDNHEKLIVLFNRDDKTFTPYKASELTTDDMARLRKKLLIESIFATKWVQIAISNNENDDYVLSSDLKTDDDIERILYYALDVWEEQEGGWDNLLNTTAVVVVMLNWDIPVVDRVIIKQSPDIIDMESIPVAVNIRRIVANTYANDDSWKVFSERICKNEFVKSHLQKKQNNLCAVCKKAIDDSAVIHHIDYDHKCAFCNSGLEWRLPRKRVQPNCELCFQEHREWFEQCVSRLRLVHSNCNYVIDYLVLLLPSQAVTKLL